MITLLCRFHTSDFHANFQIRVVLPDLGKPRSRGLPPGGPGSRGVLESGSGLPPAVAIFCRKRLPRVLGERHVGLPDQLLAVCAHFGRQGEQPAPTGPDPGPCQVSGLRPSAEPQGGNTGPVPPGHSTLHPFPLPHDLLCAQCHCGGAEKLGPAQTSPAALALELDSMLPSVPATSPVELGLVPDPE